MRGFLEEVASDLYTRYGDRLSDCTVLFPSRRARLFFVDALSQIVQQPIWQPQWTTIDDLMTEISGLRTGDRVRLIVELYKVYSSFHDESFDKFYFWGDMLLADFDTIDKYRINADMLFRNISDIKEIEADISYLSAEQLQIIRSFWSTLISEDDLSEEKRKFLAIWKTLGPIYQQYRARLMSLGIAYNGMVQRAAAERMESGTFVFGEKRHFIVAGFNALSECEKQLFRFLSATTETDFYWDYDTYYKENPEQEAGMFIRQNVVQFPACTEMSHDNMLRPKQLTTVATVSNVVQCKYAAKILQELAQHKPLDKQTAVVLTDENLLMPLLYSLPPELGRVNVTMGYPLRSTLAYTFVERLIALQHHRRTKEGESLFYHVDITGLLTHPYLVGIDPKIVKTMQEQIVREQRILLGTSWLGQNEWLSTIFRPITTWQDLSDYLVEVITVIARLPFEGVDTQERVAYLAVVAEEIVKLRNSLDNCDIALSNEVYVSLLRRHLQTLRIPFEGEPLEGIQVMGILETRNLDFRHVIILSMNDDNFPGNHVMQGSFVPYNLRTAYELPTSEHHEGVYAYYFYRLIQRAETVHMLYCSHADEKSTGEPSRYIRQLDYESDIPLHKIRVGVDANLTEVCPIEVPKTEAVMKQLMRFTDPENPATLSPTAFFRYIACPLRFYFHSVARLTPEEEVSEEVDAPMFGTILHAAAQQLYERVVGEWHPAQTLQAMIRSGDVTMAVKQAINENYLQNTQASEDEYTGNLLLVKDIVSRYLQGGVMAHDIMHDLFTVQGLEQSVSYAFPISTSEGERNVKFAGIADRIDRLDDGTLRVVDYKTGTPHLNFDGVVNLFYGEGKQRLSNIVQTLLYAMMLYHSQGLDIEPALYYVRTMNQPDYDPRLNDKEENVVGARYSYYREKFEELVRETLEKLFDPNISFVQCEDADTCKFCDFKTICKR